MVFERLVLPLALALGACTGGHPNPDGTGPGGGGGVSGAGGGGGSGGGGGGVPDGGGGRGGAGGAIATDARIADAPVDAPREAGGPVAPVDGAPGCAQGSFCWNVKLAYAEAILRAQSCAPGATNVCTQAVPGSLGCGSCQRWITPSAEVDSLRAQFQRGNCEACLFDSPTGDRCHPVVCPDLLRGTCTAVAGGRGTCTIEQQPEQCPQGAATGQPCPLVGWYCKTVTAPQRSCICRMATGDQMSWYCG